METKIYGYAARDAVLNAKGDVISSRLYIYDEKPHLETSVRMENGRIKTTDAMWHSAGNCFPAPYGSFIGLNWNDEPRKVLITINDAEFDEDEDGNPIVGSENVSLVVSR